MAGDITELKARLELLEAHTQSFRRLTRSYIRGELSHSQFVMNVALLCLEYDVKAAGHPDVVARLYDSACDCPFCVAVRNMREIIRVDVVELPVVDLEDGCAAPAAHDGSGDCGCPTID